MRTTLYKNGLGVRALTVATRSAAATVNGDTIDRYQAGGTRGNYHGGVLFIVLTGTATDGTHTFAVQDSDDGSSWAAAAASDVQGTAPVLTSASDDITADVGYCGVKRYCRLTVTTAGATTGANFGAVAYLYGATQR